MRHGGLRWLLGGELGSGTPEGRRLGVGRAFRGAGGCHFRRALCRARRSGGSAGSGRAVAEQVAAHGLISQRYVWDTDTQMKADIRTELPRVCGRVPAAPVLTAVAVAAAAVGTAVAVAATTVAAVAAVAATTVAATEAAWAAEVVSAVAAVAAAWAAASATAEAAQAAAEAVTARTAAEEVAVVADAVGPVAGRVTPVRQERSRRCRGRRQGRCSSLASRMTTPASPGGCSGLYVPPQRCTDLLQVLLPPVAVSSGGDSCGGGVDPPKELRGRGGAW